MKNLLTRLTLAAGLAGIIAACDPDALENDEDDCFEEIQNSICDKDDVEEIEKETSWSRRIDSILCQEYVMVCKT